MGKTLTIIYGRSFFLIFSLVNWKVFLVIMQQMFFSYV